MYALLMATLAGLCTGIGSAIALSIKQLKGWQLSLILGFSAGVMTYVSFVELLSAAVVQGGMLRANTGFFTGFAFIALLDLVIPHQYKAEQLDGDHPLLRGISGRGQKPDGLAQTSPGMRAGALADGTRRRYRGGREHSSLFRIGVFTALGIAIHNIPEGLVVFSGVSTGDVRLGLLVAVAIGLHNIPEGITVSVPIKEATGNTRMAFLLSFASGMAEPLGALLGYLVFSPFLTPMFIAGLLAFAAGIMIYISLDELIPAAHQYGSAHWVILGIGLGMVVMAVSSTLIT